MQHLKTTARSKISLIVPTACLHAAVILERLIFTELVGKFPTLYENCRFIAVVTKASH
jgi:hypothetical protein